MNRSISLFAFGVWWLTSLCCYAQSTDVLAKAAFVSAQEYYGNGDYKSAIEKLIEVKTYLQSTNPRIDHLLTLCFAETGEVDKARSAMKSYFDQAADTDPNYMQMLGMVDKLNNLEIKTKENDEEDALWKKVKSTNNPSAFTEYLVKYPNGKYIMEAKIASTGTFGPKLTDQRDGKVYLTVQVGRFQWMAEDLNFEAGGGYFFKKSGQRFYNQLDVKKMICPIGWRLPTIEDVMTTLKDIGITQSIVWTGGEQFSGKYHNPYYAKISDPLVESLFLGSDWGIITGNNKTNLSIKASGEQSEGTLMLLNGQFHIYTKNEIFASFTKSSDAAGA